MIGLTIGATALWFTHRGTNTQSGNTNGGSSSAATGDIASANDTGPVGIITEEPTCGQWAEIEGAAANQNSEWNKRNADIPASAWTPEQRQTFESAATVFKAEADQLVALARATPHRVMREIYSQIIAYNRAYAGAIPTYTPADDYLATARNALASTVNAVCDTVRNYAAVKRAASVGSADAPTVTAAIDNLAEPQRFITAPTDTCAQFLASSDRLASKLDAWYKTDPRIPASQRSAADSVLWDMAAKALTGAADERAQLGRASGNPIIEDFLVMSAQYYRAYIQAIPTYVKEDARLYDVGRHLGVAMNSACQAVPR